VRDCTYSAPLADRRDGEALLPIALGPIWLGDLDHDACAHGMILSGFTGIMMFLDANTAETRDGSQQTLDSSVSESPKAGSRQQIGMGDATC
jgi:hypothetical protein